MVADAACLLTQALLEYRDGELHPATKMLGGYLIASLYELRQYTAGYLPFDEVARHYGKLVLRERHDDVSDVALDELVSWPLDILAKVVRSQLH
jgi:hypothetical protein